MIKHSLNGAWQFRQANQPDPGEQEWLPGCVPGCVHTDLMAAGRIPDPFVGLNEKEVQWVAEQDWQYRRTFRADAFLLQDDHIELVCDGLDTLAEVTVNGRPVGQAENMFRTYRWEVKPLLQPGENEIAVTFHSPVRCARERMQARSLPNLAAMGLPGGWNLRKAPSHFGWDWGPMLPTLGIWKDIRLESWSSSRLADVHLRQEHRDGRVFLTVIAAIEGGCDGELSLTATIATPGGRQVIHSEPIQGSRHALMLEIENPQLWWPNGYGGQPLYQVSVQLSCNRQTLDERSFQLGLRTLALQRRADEWGESFAFVVNGVPVFGRGANWIPADSFLTRLTPARYEDLIRSATLANHTMLRVWGGGIYEDEVFYDLCDRYGLLVWQDFMFACSLYPLDGDAFLQDVRAEVADNVRRLRHRASLALWCGNNEVEMMWSYFPARNSQKYAGITAAHERFFYHLLPEWVQAEDPDRPYWPGSPVSGTFMQSVNTDERGDTHLWEVWHGLQPFTFYRTKHSRFVSEFGFEALPGMQTIGQFAPPEEWDMLSPVLLHHQRSAGGNEKILYYLTGRFRLPKAFPDLVYLSQVLQAEAVRTGVEHWRRSRARCGGTLYWQLNDCWPVVSWASLDYYGRWKALHYAARRFYRPVLLSVEDTPERLALSVTNDLPQDWQSEVRWSLETFQGEVVSAEAIPVQAAGLQTTPAAGLDLAQVTGGRSRKELVFVYELWQGGELCTRAALLLANEKDVHLPAPAITANLRAEDRELAIHLKAGALARFVQLELAGADAVFSDNFFDLPAGRSQVVTCPLPEGWTVEQARAALRVRSLADCRETVSPLKNTAVQWNSWAKSVWALVKMFAAVLRSG